MTEDDRKAFATFWRSQFLQGVIFRSPRQKKKSCFDAEDTSTAIESMFSTRWNVENLSQSCAFFSKSVKTIFCRRLLRNAFSEAPDAEKSGSAVKGGVLRTPRPWITKMHWAEQILAWAWDRQVENRTSQNRTQHYSTIQHRMTRQDRSSSSRHNTVALWEFPTAEISESIIPGQH